MTSSELLALNPGYNINKLQIGEVLTLSASVPYLTMTVEKQERYLDDVAYDIEYTDDASLYQGDYKVTSRGEYGKADVLAKTTYVNGEETERTILSSVTLKEPVTGIPAPRHQGAAHMAPPPAASAGPPVGGSRPTSAGGDPPAASAPPTIRASISPFPEERLSMPPTAVR